MATGSACSLAAEVAPAETVPVVGNGAVGLCGLIAARRLGAEQIIIRGRGARAGLLASAERDEEIVEDPFGV